MKTWEIRVDAPLVSIEFELQDIRFRFTEQAFAFGTEFRLVRLGQTYDGAEAFEPWEKRGNLNSLWTLITERCTHTAMDEHSLKLFFESGCYLECRNLHSVPEQVNIWGAAKRRHGIELTNYPGDYLNWLERQ